MITVNWATKVINVPQSYLTPVTGTLYELDTNQFRLDLKALEAEVVDAGAGGMAFEDTHTHNAPVTVAGTTFARTLEIINGYSVEFEDGQYSVRLVGSNNNIFDVENGILVQNQVQVIAQNSAGLIVVTSGSGVTAQDKTDIINGVWDEVLTSHSISGSASMVIRKILGLSNENLRSFNNVYDSNKNLTSATLKIYDSASDADNDINEIASYSFTATYNTNNTMISHKAVLI